MRIALATGPYAFHCRVVLVQEARCEVGDDWMVALYGADEASRVDMFCWSQGVGSNAWVPTHGPQLMGPSAYVLARMF